MPNVVQVSNKPYVRLATRADAFELAPRLRKDDVDEISHSYGLPPEPALRYCLATSNIAYAVIWRGKVVALFGIAEWPAEEGFRGVGSPWMLASDELKSIRKSFLRECRGYVQEWLDVHGHLENWVWKRNITHIQWLRWLGFTLADKIPSRITGETFIRFYMTKSNSGGDQCAVQQQSP